MIAYGGNIWILEDRLSSSLPAGNLAVPSEDGSLVHEFSPDGTHLRTLDSVTGTSLFTFTSTPEGKLAGIRDRDGDLTVIERSAEGEATLASADGHITALQFDPEGYLSSVMLPDDSRYWQTPPLGYSRYPQIV